MIKEAEEITCEIVTDMINMMRNTMRDPTTFKIIQPYYYQTMSSIASSLLTTILMTFASCVAEDDEKEHRKAFDTMAAEVFNKVKWAYDAQANQANDDYKLEIH